MRRFLAEVSRATTIMREVFERRGVHKVLRALIPAGLADRTPGNAAGLIGNGGSLARP